MSCNSSDQQTYCSSASPELKLYQAFIFSVPVFFTFILLLLFYVFYLRRRRANWQSMRMRATQLGRGEIPRSSRSGIKKEVREMLPVVVFKESFLIRETQCSVCLGDYQSDDRLQRIPPCGHTFHVDCIDHWLSTNTTCPLCRVSLLPSAITHTDPLDHQGQASGGQSEEQSVESLTSILVVHSDDVEGEVEERERVCSCNVVREVEDIRSNGEGSVTAIVADSSEENTRC